MEPKSVCAVAVYLSSNPNMNLTQLEGTSDYRIIGRPRVRYLEVAFFKHTGKEKR